MNKKQENEYFVKLEHVKFEKLLNGIFYALQQLDKGIIANNNKKTLVYMQDASDSLKEVLKEMY